MAKIGLDHNPATAEGSLLAVPRGEQPPPGYALYKRSDRNGSLVWEEKAPVSVARWVYDGVDVLNGEIYLIGGRNGSGSYTTFGTTEKYDSVSDSWETLASMSTPRAGVSSGVLNGELYAIGGQDSSGALLDSVEIYNPSSSTWTEGPSLPSILGSGCAINVDGKIYLIGGGNGGGVIKQVLSLDNLSNQWNTHAEMPTARGSLALVWFNNRIWALGGNNGSASNIVESYDPYTDTWRSEISLNINREFPMAWVNNGAIYVAGGYDGIVRLNSVEKYVHSQRVGSAELPENKYAAGSVVHNGKFYCCGATSSESFQQSLRCRYHTDGCTTVRQMRVERSAG